MTDTSPEAVERLAQRHALYDSAKYPTAATLRALAAENARLRAENAAAYQRGAEAYNILSAAIKEQEAGNQRFAAIVSERVATGGPLSFAVEDLDGPDLGGSYHPRHPHPADPGQGG